MTITPADQTAHDPLTVQCIDCLAPAGTPCRRPDTAGIDGLSHAARYDSARHAAAVPGTCDLCGMAMYRFTAPDDAYHLPGVSDACPPLPDPMGGTSAWNAYATATSGTGVSPGHPGPAHWRPVDWPGDTITDGELHSVTVRIGAPVTAAALEQAVPSPLNPLCPECKAGKCVNCTGDVLVSDTLEPCAHRADKVHP